MTFRGRIQETRLPVNKADRGEEGTRIAKLFREHRVGLDVRCCDLDQICDDDDIERFTAREAVGHYAACLMCCPDGQGGLIALAPGQDPGRRRFSIAHELGHYHIPKHKKTGAAGACSDRDMRASHPAIALQEREANMFATELLMPRKLFAADARGMDVSISSAMQLAAPAAYAVSVTAAAWRIMETTREAAAMVVSTDGKVDWMIRSAAFWVPLTEKGQPVGTETLASTTFSRKRSSEKPLEVDPAAWFEQASSMRGTVLESTHFIEPLNQVVSILWLPETAADWDSDSTNGPD